MRKIVCLLMCMVFISIMGTGCQGKSSRVTCAEGEVIVTFEPEGGNHINPIILPKGGRVPDVPQPHQNGKKFTGWYSKDGKRFMETVPVEDNITVTAKWVDDSVTTYLVTFDSDGGTRITPIQVEEGQGFGDLPQPLKGGYVFGGWFEKLDRLIQSDDLKGIESVLTDFGPRFTESTPVVADITVIARWIDENDSVFKVTFDPDNGSEIAPRIVKPGEPIGYLPDSKKDNETNVGWFLPDGSRVTSTTPINDNVTVEAKWVPDTTVTHLVSFDSRGGIAVQAMRVETGGTLVTLPEPTLEGMTFRGWFTEVENGDPFYATTPVTEDITVYARWTPPFISYTVTFNSDPGTPVDPIQVAEGGTLGTLPVSEREGYTFLGWYMEDQYPFTGSTVVTKDITVVARWVDGGIPVFTVSFDADGGAHVPSILVADAGTINPLPVSSKDGHTFLGWFMADGNRFTALTPVRADIPLKARWADTGPGSTTVIYTVTFDSDGGTPADPIQVMAGQSLTTLPEPVKEGATFTGWYIVGTTQPVQFKSYTPVNSDIDLKASWKTPAVNHKIDFDSNGGGSVSSADVQDKGSLGTLPVPTPPKEGDIFVGWFTDNGSHVGASTSHNSDDTLIAKWAEEGTTVYTVTFDSDKGSLVEPMKVISGDTIKVQPEPERDGYIFIGWFMEDGSRFTSTTRVYKNLTLKALWVDDNTTVYVVTYDSAGGIPVASMKVAAGTSVVTVAEPTRQDYVFAGWFMENGTVAFTGSTLVYSDITVTANWKTPYVGYLITFDSDNGSAVAPITVPEGGTTGTLPVPVKAGFDFNGWLMVDGTVFSASTPVYSNLTLKANWIAKEIITFTVTFDADGGSTVPSMKVEAGQPLTNLPSTFKSDYIFTDWFMEDGNRLTLTTPIRADITVKARWVNEKGAVLHTVRFDSNGGNSLPPISVLNGDTVRTLPEPSRNGATFTGWYLSDETTRFSSTTPVTADITVYAHWNTSGVNYTVSFDSAGGSAVASITVPAGGSLGTLPVPVWEGRIFGGWVTENSILFGAATPVTANISLTARWVSTQTTSYIVNFESNGGTPVGPVPVSSGQALGFLPDSTRTGYDLIGWFDENGTPVTRFTMINRDMTATARWTTAGATLYTVTFEADGGTEVPPIPVAAGGTLGIVPVSEKAGFNFAGWYLGGIQFTGSTPVNADIEVTAKWVDNAVKVFKVDFDADGGSEVAPMYVEDGKTLEVLPASVKESYTFAGWLLEDNNRLYSSTPIRSDQTAKARWVETPVIPGQGTGTYTVTFETFGGSDIEPMAVEAGDILATLPEPVRSGDVFLGWELGGVPFTSTTPVNEDIQLDATWAASTTSFTVRFEANGGSHVDPVAVPPNGSLGTLPVTEREGYVFGGWFMENKKMFSGSTKVTANMTVTAKWFEDHLTLFTVSFDAKKGTPVPPVLVEQNTSMGWLPDSERTGYQLIGWYMKDGNRFYDSTVVRADIQVEASWHEDGLPPMVTVTFNSIAGSSEVAPVRLPAGESLKTLPEAVRPNSTLVGWYLPNGDRLTTQTLIPTDVEVTAGWVTYEIAHTVTFESNGGSAVAPVRIQDGGSLGTLPVPTKIGYVFAGWEKLDKFPFTASTPVIEDITVYARWIDESVQAFLVTFDSKGGTLVPPIMVADGESLEAIPVPELKGQKFLGWFTLEGNPFTEHTPVRANITVTASWVEDTTQTYRITFNSAGGPAVPTRDVPAWEPIGPLPEPKREGYTFDGWYDGNVRFTPTTLINADIEVTARWSTPMVSYTVTFNPDGGNPQPAPVTVQAGGTLGTMPSTAKPGHIFLGWYNDLDGSYFTVFTPVTADTFVTARWDDNATDPFVVFFDAAGGMPVAPAVVPAGGTVKPLMETTKEGFIFMSWRMDDTDRTRFTSNTPVRRTMTVTADWEADTTQVYTVTFDSGPGSPVDPIKVVAGTAVGTLPQPTRDDFIFDRWVLAGATFDENSVVTGNITVTADWTAPVYYTVVFQPNNGNTAIRVAMPHGGTVGSLPSAPTRAGYTFTGWFVESTTTPFTASTVVTSSMTVNAVWNQITYTVTFNTGEGGPTVAPITDIPAGTTISLPPNPTKPGHDFVNWLMSNGVVFVENVTIINSNKELTANWTVHTFTVTFEAAGGTTVAPITLDYGTSVGEFRGDGELPTTTRNGYNFGGWLKEDDSKLGADEPMYGDITVEAYWLPMFEKMELDDVPTLPRYLSPKKAVLILNSLDTLVMEDDDVTHVYLDTITKSQLLENDSDIRYTTLHKRPVTQQYRLSDEVFYSFSPHDVLTWHLGSSGEWESLRTGVLLSSPPFMDSDVWLGGTGVYTATIDTVRYSGISEASFATNAYPGFNYPLLDPIAAPNGNYQLVYIENRARAMVILGNVITIWNVPSLTSSWTTSTSYTLSTMPNVSINTRLTSISSSGNTIILVCGEDGSLGTISGSGSTWTYTPMLNNFRTASCVYGLYNDEEVAGITPALAVLGDTTGTNPVREVRYIENPGVIPVVDSVVVSGEEAANITGVTPLADGKVLTVEPGIARIWSRSGTGWESGEPFNLNGDTSHGLALAADRLMVFHTPTGIADNRPQMWRYNGTDWTENRTLRGDFVTHIDMDMLDVDNFFIGGTTSGQDTVRKATWTTSGSTTSWVRTIFATYDAGTLKGLKTSKGGYLAVLLADNVTVYTNADNTTFQVLEAGETIYDIVFFSDDRLGIVVDTDLVVYEYNGTSWQQVDLYSLGAMEQAELLDDGILIGRQGTTITAYFLDGSVTVPRVTLSATASTFGISGTAREVAASISDTTVRVWNIQDASNNTYRDITMDGPHTFIKLREGFLIVNHSEYRYVE